MRVWDFGRVVAASVLLGLVFHAAWVVLFIFASSQGASRLVKVMLWLLAPVISAVGFGTGLGAVAHGVPRRKTRFRPAFRMALIGCAIGAVVMSPLGPMVVGFGVLAGGGMAAVVQCLADERALRVWASGREKRSGPDAEGTDRAARP